LKGYRHAGLEEPNGQRAERAAEPKSATNYVGRLRSAALATLIGFICCLHWPGLVLEQEPALFPVQQNAQAAAERRRPADGGRAHHGRNPRPLLAPC
jgi:hypothetical protein